MINLSKGQTIYWARIIPSCNIYELLELKVRTITDDYFVAIENRDKQAFLFNSLEEEYLFTDRPQCLEYLKNEELKYKGD